jgi:hypothetical protein
MYRPALTSGQQQGQQPQQASVRSVFFSEKNYRTLETVLVQDFEERQGQLGPQERERLGKSLNHYCQQVYQKQGDKPIPQLNKEVLGICSKDFSQYLQRKGATNGKDSVKQVMDEGLFQETSQRFERLTQERNEVKALPSSLPDFRISLTEDGPPAAEMFERAKKQRELEMLRASQGSEMAKAEAGVQGRVMADSAFRAQQDMQNRSTELALVQRQAPVRPKTDMPLVILPDRRELMMGAVGSFDSMTASPDPRDLGLANGNPTTILPMLASPNVNSLQQNVIIREDNVISYREIENNLFLYSADRDWLHNSKENRYHFSVTFDPAANGQGFGSTLAAQQKFKNIVRIEMVKAIMPGEGLSVTVNHSDTDTNTDYQDNILNLPYVMVRVAELENNNYGTDNFLDRSFGVLQYDAQWISDHAVQRDCTRGYLAMIPKFMKCQKEYYPTPLSTLQKLSIEIVRPNGEILSPLPDTFDITGIIAPQTGATMGTTSPFDVDLSGLDYDVLLPAVTGDPANFYINTSTFFSKFQMCVGDRIQIRGYTYADATLNDPTYGSSLRAFCNWVNQTEGHVVLGAAYWNGSAMVNDFNSVGYANYIVIQARYQDPSTGSTSLSAFGPDFGATLNAFGVSLQSPVRLINLNKQLSMVFRIITREMDSLPQLRPDNNY